MELKCICSYEKTKDFSERNAPNIEYLLAGEDIGKDKEKDSD